MGCPQRRSERWACTKCMPACVKAKNLCPACSKPRKHSRLHATRRTRARLQAARGRKRCAGTLAARSRRPLAGGADKVELATAANQGGWTHARTPWPSHARVNRTVAGTNCSTQARAALRRAASAALLCAWHRDPRSQAPPALRNVGPSSRQPTLQPRVARARPTRLVPPVRYTATDNCSAMRR